ncbi:MAG: DUF2188 domain-containing protein [Candidatus Saccharibacteria bacterium]|nr:DUF2188 domain-containing protein [Candidatus Saccharibacteria bacterium]
MGKPNYHVSGNRGKGYSVKREGAERISAHVRTKAEAVKLAKQFCGNKGGGEVRIHGKDGKITDSDTVPKGNNPCPPRDKVM